MATKIVGIEGMTFDDLDRQIADGGHFVYYQYAISILVMTFRRGSDIYFIPAGQSRAAKGLPYTLLTFVLGWWGIPWGPIYSIGSLYTNLAGGKVVTDEVWADLCAQARARGPATPARRLEEADAGTAFVPSEDR